MIFPLPVNLLMRGTLADVENIYVLEQPNTWDMGNRISVDVSAEERKALLELLDKLRVNWVNYRNGRSYRTGEHIYALVLCRIEGERRVMLLNMNLDESGNLYVGNFHYTGDTAALVDFVRTIWDAQE